MAAAVLLALAASQAAPASGPAAPLEAFRSAAAFCEGAVQTSDVTVPFDVAEFYVGNFQSGVVKPVSKVPPLVQRFAAAQPAARAYPLQAYLRFPSTAGSAWAVLYAGGACDVMLTGADDAPALGRQLGEQLTGAGWTLFKSVESGPGVAMVQWLWYKRLPRPDEPAFGIRMLMQWPTLTAEERDVVQLEVSFLAGDLKVSNQSN